MINTDDNYFEFLVVPVSSSHQAILGRLSTVLDSFSIISSKGIFDPMRVNDLVANHLRSSPLQKSTFISHSTTIAKMMTEFAMSQFVFMSLDSSDKVGKVYLKSLKKWQSN